VQDVKLVHCEFGADVKPVGQLSATALALGLPGDALKLVIVVSEVRLRTFSRPGQNVPESVQGVMLATVVNVPFGRL
jgi:hypothetical protein